MLFVGIPIPDYTYLLASPTLDANGMAYCVMIINCVCCKINKITYLGMLYSISFS